jgi:hypothetical protein
MKLAANENSAWIPNTDLTPLDPASCKDVPEKGKSKLLLAAYAVAAEGHDLKHFKDLLADHQRALQQELEEQEAQQAAKEAAKAEREAKKNKRKSMDIVDDLEDIDMEDADEPKKAKASKKRKKDAETDGEAEKVSCLHYVCSSLSVLRRRQTNMSCYSLLKRPRPRQS